MSRGPHFLGIGAQRAGTTWLYANLSAQPGIWMPPVKELHYFDEKAHVGAGFLMTRAFGRREVDRRWRRQASTQLRSWRRQRRRPTRWELRYLLGLPSDDWYLRLFRRGDGRVTGEITPNYMILEPADIEHLCRLLPGVRIILMVRNPIERAWSSSMMMTGDSASPESAMIIERERSYRQTDYLSALDRWSAHFPPERIFVGFMEDVIQRPEPLLSEICRFLGVNEAGRFRRAGKVIHQGSVSSMPAAMAARLAEIYGPLARDMAGRLGGYAGFWAFCADRLQGGHLGAEDVRYPFLQTGLREEWLAAGGQLPEGLQSGTLDRVLRRA